MRHIFTKNNILVASNSQNTICQKWINTKDQDPWHKQSNIAYAVKCQEDCCKLYTWENKQCQWVVQHIRATLSSQRPTVYLHASSHFFTDENLHNLDGESRRSCMEEGNNLFELRKRFTIVPCCHQSTSPTLCEQHSWPLISSHNNLHINNHETDLVTHCQAMVLVSLCSRYAVWGKSAETE